MSRTKKPLAQTREVDMWKCPWCRELNSYEDLGGTPDPHMDYYIDCPQCGNEVLVMMSIEFTCQPTIDGEDVDDTQ